jgi:class 3 adenylate cyclase
VSLGHGVSFPWERILELDGTGETLVPTSPEITVIRVGRGRDNDLVLDYPTVSGYHAQILISQVGAEIEDLGSMNGTALNEVGNKIRRSPLRPSDVVFFGAHRIPASQFLTTDPMTARTADPRGSEQGSTADAAPKTQKLPIQPRKEEPAVRAIDPPIERAQWKPEFACVLFTDIVGFTLLDPARQLQSRQMLEHAVQDADAFRQAKRENIIVARPTGDGVALVFFAHASLAAECAVQIAKLLQNNTSLSLRMGIHQGTVYRMTDINGSEDVSGAGINMAQRVMDCGNAGHILVSASVAEALKGTMDWHPFVHVIGLRKVKHGDSIEIYNLRGPNFGCELEPPSKL